MAEDILFEQFDLLADTPGGVQKLRELILQLAVQGKLVPQDPEDEPASLLLERIKEEKERLVNEGKIKKQKPLPEIKPEEVPFELPEGWEWTCFEEVGIVNPRNNLSDETEVSFIPMPMISEAYGIQVQSGKDTWERLKKGYTHLAENDIVLAKITPCFQNKKSTIMKGLINNYGAGTTELHVLRPVNNLIVPEYALMFLKSPRYIAEGIPKMTGSAGQKRVPKDYFAERPFPLPPLSEQYRIVAKVDQLMALCDELEAKKEKQKATHARLNKSALQALRESKTNEDLATNWTRVKDNFRQLFTTPESVQELRSTILQLAVQGKLVPQNSQDEPASALLERIREEKQRLVKEGKIKKQKPLPEIKPEEVPFELPEGWEWVRLEYIAKNIEYGTSHKSMFSSEGVPVFGMNHIKHGKLIFDNLKKVPADIKDLPRLLLKKYDLLFNRTNSYDLVGKTALFELDSNKYSFASYLIRVSLFIDYVSPYFINFSLNSKYFRENQIEQQITQQCGQANFNGTKLRNSLVPIPPLSEQHSIVAKVDQFMTLCDELESNLAQSHTDGAKLMAAVIEEVSGSRQKSDAKFRNPTNQSPEEVVTSANHKLSDNASANPQPANTAPPSPEPSTAGSSNPESDKSKSNNTTAAILAYMQPGEQYTRSDIMEALGLSVSAWNTGIRELKEQGYVVQTGEKRGARYGLSDLER
jgi:type I restriction enzyme S subunit